MIKCVKYLSKFQRLRPTHIREFQMKNYLFLYISLFLVASATRTFAQPQEVKGVETKWVIYEGKPYECSGSRGSTTYNTYYGYEFSNRNKYQITVEMELYEKGEYRDKIITTKSFVLDDGENYVFKQEDKEDFHEHSTWLYHTKASSKYYIKFKSFKNE